MIVVQHRRQRGAADKIELQVALLRKGDAKNHRVRRAVRASQRDIRHAAVDDLVSAAVHREPLGKIFVHGRSATWLLGSPGITVAGDLAAMTREAVDGPPAVGRHDILQRNVLTIGGRSQPVA